MIDPFGLNKLNEVEQGEADRAEAYIDDKIREAFDVNPETTVFEVKTVDLSNEIDGLSLKVRAAVLKRYVDNKWKVAVDETRGIIVLTRPVRKRGGGRPKGSKNTPKLATPAEPPAAEALAKAPAKAL